MNAPADGLPPTVPAHLQLVRSLGAGGMGSVYLVRDTRLHRLGALKVIRDDFRHDPEMRALFLEEARLSARLQHPGIVPVYDFVDDASGSWQLFRYVEGESLADRFRREGSLPAGLVRQLLTDLADTLEFAHRAGVVHRDLKPDNVLLDGAPDRPRPVIADFGVAKRAGRDQGPGERRLLFGTPAFMAPEQAAGEHDVDGRADLYSLGVIGYLLLAGRLPYDAARAESIAAAAATGRRIPLAEAAPNAPSDLVAVIDRCLAPDPADRWQRAEALREALTGRAETDRPLRSLTPRPVPTRRIAAGGSDASAGRSGARRGALAVPLGSELRIAARSLRRTPAVTGAALICLALGIGATTAIFSAVNRALLSPLPFREPDRLVSVFRTTPQFSDAPFAPANVTDLIRDARTVQLAAMAPSTGFLQRPEGSDRVRMIRASADLFRLLGVRATQGRLLTAADGEVGAPPAAMLSDEIWRTTFGADSGVTGRTIQIDGRPVTVVGVLPAGLRVPQGPQLFRADIWIPLQFDSTEAGQRRSNFVWLTGRLRDDWTLAQATTELDGLMRGLTEQFPQLAGEGLRLSALQPESRRSVRRPLLLLFAAVGFVLLIAASNVASLLLARGAERHREVAIRSALGADRSDLVREVLLEAGVLVGGGTVLGLGLAWLGVRVIGAMAAARQPQLAGLGLDGPVVAFAVVLAVVVALACGVVPALRSARVDPQTTMRSSDARAGGDSSRHRFLRLLATAEVALSAVLLLGAGLVLRGFAGLLDEPTGFDDERLLTVQVTVDAEKYRSTSSVTAFLEPALAAIRAQAGVTGAGAMNLVPYDNWGNNFNIRYEGQDATDPTRFPLAESRVVTPGVYQALGVQLVAGRLLGPEDADPDRPANVVVNEALVARDFAGRDPIGKRFHLGDTTFATIVGVVRDIKNFGPVERPYPEVDYHYAALSRPPAQYSLLVRTDGDPAGQAAAVRAAIRTVDPTAAVSLIRPMRSVIEASVGRPRFFAALLGAFAAVAVLLTVAGLYGLMSYLVAQRTREIGIRMALGSTPARTRNLVLLQGGRMVGAGLLVGMVAAFWISRLLVGLLYGVSPLDPLAWLGAVGLVLLTALGALLLPARRATLVDPQRAIRSE